MFRFHPVPSKLRGYPAAWQGTAPWKAASQSSGFGPEPTFPCCHCSDSTAVGSRTLWCWVLEPLALVQGSRHSGRGLLAWPQGSSPPNRGLLPLLQGSSPPGRGPLALLQDPLGLLQGPELGLLGSPLAPPHKSPQQALAPASALSIVCLSDKLMAYCLARKSPPNLY